MDLRGLGPDDEEAQVDADEDLEVRHFPLDEIYTLIERGEIRDMKTIVGLRYCKVP
jgi:hypothetical protein